MASSLPKVVSPQDWQVAQEALLAKEKELTRARDALAAERRRLPMTRVEKSYTFAGANGPVTLRELFGERSQLIVYHFMFAPGVHGWPTAGCPGCSMFVDNLGEYMLPHLVQRDVSFAVISRGPLAALSAYRERMGWSLPFYSSENNTFNVDFGVTTDQGENHGLSVLIREGDHIYRTYFSTARGVEQVGTVWSLLDLTPYGRQESWEDTPQGRPQSPPYQWWRRHDEYEKTR